jgi:ribose-phosphate pyrophosphokinase
LLHAPLPSASAQTNDAVMEMLILANASKIASAQRVTLVVPYFPYAKQNKIKKRGAIPARLIADMMKVAGAMHVITVDLNPAQMAGFFQIPIDNIMLWPLMTQYVTEQVPDYEKCVLVAKNAGASKRADKLARMLGLDIAMVIDCANEDDCESCTHHPPPPCFTLPLFLEPRLCPTAKFVFVPRAIFFFIFFIFFCSNFFFFCTGPNCPS